ncbi:MULTISPECIES: 2'-5' RNA ligase family protein [unclassified Pseudonocardia]|uniref:2'-5' RNA ligase family protein n=1 Tax=unclassified Pseudonocardia TaxID=2619320 RepID=UPI001CF66B16|nr:MULTISPECIES: 2'-5' RNA ligase family protein [unclassified Pseudonocardia]
MRLFTALWPPPEAVAALTRALDEVPPRLPDGARPTDPSTWHVTLCFHGDDDPDTRASALDDALARAVAPRLRIAGTGTFPGVLWAGVEESGGPVLPGLAARAGATGPRPYRPHVTLARWDRRRGDATVAGDGIAAGPWWTPGEAVLVRSDPGARYTVVHRVPLCPGTPDHTPG